MITVEYRKIELDSCPNCRGVWFDKRELELLLETAGVESGIPLIENARKSTTQTGGKKRRCPICTRTMLKTTVGDGKGVLIDVCEYGHGLWFDGGEVDQLMEMLYEKSPKSGHHHVFNFMKDVFQAQAGK